MYSPTLYFDNIARYVEDGGAVLIAAGPELAEPGSIAQTPLQRVMPAIPDGNIIEKPYRPSVPELGVKHPVTKGLNVKYPAMPDWAPWFRYIGAEPLSGDTVMTAGEDNPLLILQHSGEGRVALLLSDHVWLWARGFQGGGPYSRLLRRLAHWMMKEPELAEENLLANSNGKTITLNRQTLEDKAEDFVLTSPSGKTHTIKPALREPGMFEGTFEATELGLYQVQNGDLMALTHVGPANPREFANVISTPDLLKKPPQ